jgi:hypothetical protein
MRGKCGRRAGVAVICLFTGWAAADAGAAIVRDASPFTAPPSAPAVPVGEAGLPSGPVEPVPPRITSVAPLPRTSKPVAPALLTASGDRPSAASSAPKLNVAQPTGGQVGPLGQVVEVPIVPEPSTGLLLCAVGLATLARRGRRQVRAGSPA